MTARPAATGANTASAFRALALPHRIKVLYVTPRLGAGHWLAQAFAADGATQIILEEVVGVTAGLARLQDEVFDAMLLGHEPPTLDALEFVEGFRAGGHDEPLIILGNDSPQHLDAMCYEAGADDYCCIAETTVRALLWRFARAIQRFNASRDNRRLVQAERQRLQQEHHEAERLLEQQRALIADLQLLNDGGRQDEDAVESSPGSLAQSAVRARGVPLDLPAALVEHYRELLRAYVIMGAGNLAHEMASLAQLLANSSISAQCTMQLHVEVLEDLIAGLGNRSARHVMNRADLLALEVLGHLADGYRERYHERRHPPRQQPLPGFDGVVHRDLARQSAA
jgi:DNA-binding response OmpR family regulator